MPKHKLQELQAAESNGDGAGEGEFTFITIPVYGRDGSVVEHSVGAIRIGQLHVHKRIVFERFWTGSIMLTTNTLMATNEWVVSYQGMKVLRGFKDLDVAAESARKIKDLNWGMLHEPFWLWDVEDDGVTWRWVRNQDPEQVEARKKLMAAVGKRLEYLK